MQRVRLLKIAGDDGKGDFVPAGFWAEGEMPATPVPGFSFVLVNVTNSSEGESEGGVSTEIVFKVFNNQYGYLFVTSNKELWSVVHLSE